MYDFPNWHDLAKQLGALQDSRESGSDDYARRALEILIGEEHLKGAVDSYVTHAPGSELVRSVLHVLHSWVAMQHCYELYQSADNIEVRRSAVELLRVVADRRALVWVGNFLSDADVEIQAWGIGVVDQIGFSGLISFEECEELLKIADNHGNPYVRERAQDIRRMFQSRRLRLLDPPLLRAAAAGNADRVQQLLAENATVHAQNEFGLTALMLASEEGHASIVQTLLALGEATEWIDTKNQLGETALMLAASQGHSEIVQQLLAYGAKVNQQDNLKQSPLILSAGGGHLDVVRILLEYGASADMQDIYKRTSLTRAAKEGHENIVNLLVASGAEPNMQDAEGSTPLLEAVSGGHTIIIKALLMRGALVNIANKFGVTSLMIAVCRSVDIVRVLLKYGADPNLQDQNGETALIKAVQSRDLALVSLLLEHGAAINTLDRYGRTALSYAEEDNSEVITLLKQAGAVK